MKKNCTELVFVLDRSGSMHGLEKDTIGGFNSLIHKQKRIDGECLVSMVLFNDVSKVVLDRKPLQKVRQMKEIDYEPYGCTALVDALTDAIHHIRNVHKYIREEDKPEQTLFVVMTDGLENASKKYSSRELKSLIEKQKEKGWEFLFLAANIDAVETAKNYGISSDRSVQYLSDSKGSRRNYEVLEETLCCFRDTGQIRDDWAEGIREDYESRA